MEVATDSMGSQEYVLRAGDLEIRPAEYAALVRGRLLPLTVRELQLLIALAERQGRIVSRAELYAAVWREPYHVADRSVDVYVAKLRQKLRAALPGGDFIHTHFGIGYRFTPFSQDRHSSITGSA